MIQLLRAIWERVTNFLFPDDYYSWQTLIYLGFFSFAMSWVARLSGAFQITENLIATAGWLFFAIGVGWFFEEAGIRPFGIPIAPWVAGAIVCVYVFGLVPWGTWPIALMTWPLVSVAIVAIPHFLTWELKPRLPAPPARQYLILLLVIALLISNWFQFYFRLQSWFEDYPSLLADNFNNSGFVFRLAREPEEPARGSALLTAAEVEVESTLDGTPWSYVERWLLNLNEQVPNLQRKTIATIDAALEKELWRLEARPRTLNDGYALDLMAVWSGPSSDPDGYYLEKTCLIQPRSQPQVETPEGEAAPPTVMAEVNCELAMPRKSGQPEAIAE